MHKMNGFGWISLLDNNYFAQEGGNIYCFTPVKLLWSRSCLDRMYQSGSHWGEAACKWYQARADEYECWLTQLQKVTQIHGVLVWLSHSSPGEAFDFEF